MKSWIVIVGMLSCITLKINGQSFHLSDKRHDFTPVESFYEIADSIKLNGNASAALWHGYFTIPVVQLFRHNPSFDSTTFVTDVQQIFSKKENANQKAWTAQQILLLDYRKNEQKIKNTISQMKQQDITDSIKQLLFPFLKPALRQDSLIPKQLYMVLEEGNGGLPGYVFNSMLQTAKLNHYKVGAIAAHESFHTIVGTIFNDNFNKYNQLNDFQKSLLYFMEIIAEEGIADLIDKPILGQKNSPLHADVQRLLENEDTIAITCLDKIDSLLMQCAKNGPMAFNFQDYSKNGGHIPGRFMAKCIDRAGLLNDAIENEGDPLSFFDCFQRAAKKLGLNTQLSDSSLSYLREMYMVHQ